jgi:hypothetical protein
MDEATRLAREGAERAAEHAEREMAGWMESALELVRTLASKREMLTSETIRDHAFLNGLPDPSEPRAWGAVSLRAAKLGIIEKAKTEHGEDRWVRGRHTQSHGRPVRLWASRIYQGAK